MPSSANPQPTITNPVTSSVSLVDVSARDGLQNESRVLSIEDRVELVRRMVDAGFKRLEVVSFADSRRVPQMADPEGVMAALPRGTGVRYAGLALNQRGVERALAVGVDEINFVIPVTDSFARRNQGTSTENLVRQWESVSHDLLKEGVHRTVTLAVAFGCPFEGLVTTEQIESLAERVLDHVDEISLADTIGAGVPDEVICKVDAVRRINPEPELRLHLHNSRNTGLANTWAAISRGVTTFDVTVGGIGGCPFAPGASGNVAAEDLVYMLDRSGLDSGVELMRLIDSVPWIVDRIGHEVTGQLSRSGVFPGVQE